MDLNVLKTFVAVCEYSGFSAAAEKLGYSQSTVSSQIKQLETELGVVLFDRIRKNVSMTDQGALVLGYAKEILLLNNRMIDSIRYHGSIQGEIRLAMSDSVCRRYFTDDYIEFHKKYPDIAIKIISLGTESMFDQLRKNEVDIVFTLDSHIYDSEFEICGEAVEAVRFVAPASHRLAGKTRITLEEIVKESFILTESNLSYRKMLDNLLAARSLRITPDLEIGDPNQICTLLKGSNAVSFLPEFIAESYVKEGSLVYLSVEGAEVNVWTQILMHRNKWRTLAIETFVNYYRNLIENSSKD